MKRIALPFMALMLALMGCTPQPNLIILHAGSLSVPFDEAAEAFEELNPGVTIVTEAAGSRTTVRKVTELGRLADVVAVADYTVIEDLMFPDYADWYIWFARNEMVIAYTEHSKYSDEIDGENWYQILLRDDVQYGHSNPDFDPSGYRTLMIWQLAEIYYDEPGLYDDLDAGRPPENIRPKETDLIALQQAGALDYAFQYRSVAEQHDLEYLELPEEINLSSPEFAEFYSHAQVVVSGKEPGEGIAIVGAPIIYGVTIPKNAPHPDSAIAFLKFLLGPQGQAIMAANGQPPIVPAVVSDPDRLPEELEQFVLP
ncbi:MAG: tungstate ABC transporter substrate-binding protein WtpA [Dehalococcoidia bacterium]